jgi:hypothetical protein
LTIVLTDPAYNEYFNPPLGGEAPTFIHELEHARRNTNHEDKKASHGTGYILSPKSKPGDPLFNIAKFDDCANFWARYAAQKKEGLLDLWIKNVWNKIKEDPNYVRFIEDSNSTYFGPLSKIRELENTDKKALINKLIADIEPVEAIKPIKK